MREHSVLPSLAALLALTCSLCTLVYIATLNAQGPGPCFPLALPPYTLLLYGANRLFLRRSRTVLGVGILNALALLVLLAVLLLSEGWPGFWSLALRAGLCLWATASAAQYAQQPPKLFHLLLTLDGSLVLLVLFSAFTSATGISLLWSIPIAVGCAAAVIGVLSRRVGSQGGGRSWALMGAAFGGIFLLLWLLMGTVAASAGEGIVALWQALAGFVSFLGSLLWRLLLFLFSLFPGAENGPVDLGEPLPQVSLDAPALSRENPILLAILLTGFGLLVLVVLIALARRLRRLRIGGRAAAKQVPSPLRRRSSLWAGLVRLVSAWFQAVRRRVYVWRRRNTPIGLFYILVRRCKAGPWRKRRQETPGEFFSRLKDCAQGDEELEKALEHLIQTINREFYGPNPSGAAFPQAALIRRRIGRAVRRRFFREKIPGLRRAS